MEAEAKVSGLIQARDRPSRMIVAAQALALACAVALIVVTAHESRWDLRSLGVIAAMSVISDLTFVETGSTRVKLSGSFLGIVLAAILLGGGPAAVVGLLTIAIGWFRSREAPHYLRNNLVTFAWFPLLSGLFFHAAIRSAHTGPGAAPYYLFVFVTFVLALTTNFVGIAAYQCYLDGSSLVGKARE